MKAAIVWSFTMFSLCFSCCHTVMTLYLKIADSGTNSGDLGTSGRLGNLGNGGAIGGGVI